MPNVTENGALSCVKTANGIGDTVLYCYRILVECFVPSRAYGPLHE